MTTNQVQTEEQRIAEIRRRAEKAHTLCTAPRSEDGESVFYKIDSIEGDRINVSYYDKYNQECQDVFYMYEIEPEDTFFELTKIK